MRKKCFVTVRSSKVGSICFKLLIGMLIVVLIGTLDIIVLRHTDKKSLKTNRVSTSHAQQSADEVAAKAASPYSGWKTYCNFTIAACIHYPTDWLSSPGAVGSFLNPTQTTTVSLIPWTNQNMTPNSAYIYSVTNLPISPTALDVVGYIVSDQPGYVVYDAAYVAAHGIRAGVTLQIIDGNYAFDGKSGTISLTAAPMGSAYDDITNFSQANAWFTDPDGQTDLQILRSLYYR